MENDLPLAGQVAIVTGSTQGIGAGIARRFAKAGARVVVHGLECHLPQGEKLVKELRLPETKRCSASAT